MAAMHKQSNQLQTARLDLCEVRVQRDTLLGPMPCMFVTAIGRDDPFPTLITASLLFVEMEGRWMLGHLLIEDDDRRKGFARRYVARFGPRPHWQIGPDIRADRLMEVIRAASRTAEGASR